MIIWEASGTALLFVAALVFAGWLLWREGIAYGREQVRIEQAERRVQRRREPAPARLLRPFPAMPERAPRPVPYPAQHRAAQPRTAPQTAMAAPDTLPHGIRAALASTGELRRWGDAQITRMGNREEAWRRERQLT